MAGTTAFGVMGRLTLPKADWQIGPWAIPADADGPNRYRAQLRSLPVPDIQMAVRE